MTRVLTSAELAVVTATEQERNREAWNLPRRPAAAHAHASPDSQEAALRDELATPSRTIVPTLDMNPAAQDLDWEDFLAAHSPGSRRHDLRAITAYGAYKRVRVADGQSVTETSHLKVAERISTRVRAVDAWEDEGGRSL